MQGASNGHPKQTHKMAPSCLFHDVCLTRTDAAMLWVTPVACVTFQDAVELVWHQMSDETDMSQLSKRAKPQSSPSPLIKSTSPSSFQKLQ